MSRFFCILGLLLASVYATARAQAPEYPAIAAAAAGEDPWLDTLSALLTERYRCIGQLQLSWNRARPASAPVDAELAIQSAPAELASQILVTVRATDPAGRSSDHTLILRAELWRQGWILRDPAVLGAALTPAALDTRRYDVLRERDAIPADSTLELNFSRSVPAGRLLVWRDVVRRPLVRRGQTLDVIASDGRLTITLRAVALNDAARGETVRIRNPDSKKDFIAEVVSESRAAVRF